MATRFTLLVGLLFAASFALAAGKSSSDPLIEQGEYIYRAAGCYGCHTDEKNHGQPLAGGYALATAFGTFYSPNITPDTQTGIGRWSEQDFIRALREGRSPAGDHYYPSFPYTAYTKLNAEDLHALWAYLKVQAPVKQANRKHDLKWFAPARTFVGTWKALNFTPGTYQQDTSKSAAWNRGAYLAEAATHCVECHTPRDALGGMKRSMHYAGSRGGPYDKVIPNITPDKKTGIGRWRARELAEFLETGMKPDGDSADGLMAEMIDNGLRYLSKDDLAAIAGYVLSQPPVEHAVRKAGKKPGKKEEFE